MSSTSYEHGPEFTVNVGALRSKLKRRGQKSDTPYPRGKLGFAMTREAARMMGCPFDRVPLVTEAQIWRWETGKNTPSIMWQIVLERIWQQALAAEERRLKRQAKEAAA